MKVTPAVIQFLFEQSLRAYKPTNRALGHAEVVVLCDNQPIAVLVTVILLFIQKHRKVNVAF